MRKSNSPHVRPSWILAATILSVCPSINRARADTLATWNGTTGNWSDPTKWTSNPNFPNNNTPPGTLYDAVINSGNVTLDVSPTVQLLNMGGGTLGGAGSLTIAGLFTWNGGTIATTLAPNGGFNITAQSTILGGTLINPAGQNATINGVTLLLQTSGAVGGAFLNNGTFNTTGTTVAITNIGGTANSFTNNGIINSNVTGTFSINTGFAFANNGTINVNTGTLNYAANETGSTGTIIVAAGANLNFSGGSHVLLPGSTLTGAGNMTFSTSGNTTITGTYSVTGPTTISGGIVAFNSGSPVNFSSLSLPSGTLAGNSPLSVTSPFTFNGGTLSANLTANSGINITAQSTILGGTLINPAGQNATINNVALLLQSSGAVGGAFLNNGTFSTTGTTVAITNVGGTANSFTNIGIINSNVTGTFSINTGFAFANNGTINVNTGTLNYAANETGSTGTIIVAAGANLNFSGGSHVLLPGSTITGPGNMTFSTSGNTTITGTYSVTGPTTISGGIVTFNSGALITFSSLSLPNGTLAGNSPLSVTSPFTFNGGTLSANLTANSGINITAQSTILGGTLINPAGQNATLNNVALLLQTSGAVGGVFLNNGTFNTTGASVAITNIGGAANSFTNNGIINSNVTGTFSINTGFAFANNGTINVNTGTLNYAANETGSTGTIIVAAGANLNFSGGSHVLLPGSTITGPGNMTFSTSGNTTITGTYSVTGPTTISGGIVTFNSGALITFSSLSLPNGTLAGSSPLSVTSLFTFSGGTLSANLTANGGINITAQSTISGGTLINAAGQTASINGLTLLLQGNGGVPGTFVNNGTFNAGGTSVSITNIGGTANSFTNNGVINSNVTNTFNINTGFAFANNGTINVNTGTTTISAPIANVSGTTLTGGAWNVFNATLNMPNVSDFTINAASVTLSGSSSSFTRFTNALATNNGSIHLLASRNFTAAGAFTNNGLLDLGGGTFSASSLTNNSSGTLSGFGTISVRPLNHGAIQAQGGTLSFANGINGGSGALNISPGGTLDISGGASGSSADSLQHNGNSPNTLLIGNNNLLLKQGYTNANFGVGNTFNKHANVSTTGGQIRADGDSIQTLTGNITNGTTATPSLDFGIIHVGDSITKNFQIKNTGATSGPSVLYALQTSTAGGNITDSRLSGTGVTPSNVGPVAYGASSSSLGVTITASTSGAITGQALHIANNFDNIPEQTLSITGAVNNYAVATLAKTGGNGTFILNDSTHATLDLGVLNTGSSVSTTLSIGNAVLGLSDTLAGSWTLAAPDFSLGNFTAFNNIPAGGSQSGLTANFTASTPGFYIETATLHPLSQNATPFSGTLSDFTLTLRVAVNPIPANWTGGNGNWSDSAKWSSNPFAPPVNGAPSNAIYVATVNTGNITLDVNPIVHSLTVNGGNITGSASTSISADILLLQSGQITAGSLTLGSGQSLQQSGGSLTLTSLVQTGGDATLAGGTLNTTTTTINASSTFHYNAGTWNISALILNGAVQLSAGAAGGNKLLHPSTLTLAGAPNSWTAKLDLANNNMIVAAGGDTNLPNQLKQAAHLGAWNGSGGISSSSAQAAATGSTATALAYATGSQFTANNGQTQFAGQSFLPTDTLVMYTLAGDANMDKSVTFADFLQLQNHYNQPSDWQGGDFNYDNSTTFADFLILQNNYNKTLTASSLNPATSTTAPEPSTLLLLLIPLTLTKRRRPTKVPNPI